MNVKNMLCLVLLASQFAPFPVFAQEPFTSAHFTPTDGKVGYRMGLGIEIDFEDDPVGNTGGPVSGSCKLGWEYLSHAGELPPGIVLDPNIMTVAVLDVFAGTPRQPGRWNISVAIRIWCNGGPDLTVYERQVPVTFNIVP